MPDGNRVKREKVDGRVRHRESHRKNIHLSECSSATSTLLGRNRGEAHPVTGATRTLNKENIITWGQREANAGHRRSLSYAKECTWHFVSPASGGSLNR